MFDPEHARPLTVDRLTPFLSWRRIAKDMQFNLMTASVDDCCRSDCLLDSLTRSEPSEKPDSQNGTRSRFASCCDLDIFDSVVNDARLAAPSPAVAAYRAGTRTRVR